MSCLGDSSHRLTKRSSRNLGGDAKKHDVLTDTKKDKNPGFETRNPGSLLCQATAYRQSSIDTLLL